MKNNATIPALSIDGWVGSPVKAADYLFSHIFLSDFSQTYLYHGNVSSVAYIMHKNQSSITNLARELTNLLKNYFERYFDTVNCEVVDSSGDGFTGSVTVTLEFMDEGVIYTLNKVIEYTDSKVKKIIDAL